EIAKVWACPLKNRQRLERIHPQVIATQYDPISANKCSVFTCYGRQPKDGGDSGSVLAFDHSQKSIDTKEHKNAATFATYPFLVGKSLTTYANAAPNDDIFHLRLFAMSWFDRFWPRQAIALGACSYCNDSRDPAMVNAA